MEDKEGMISAFAFNVGRTLEKMVEERNGNQREELEHLQASILRFREEIENNTNMLRIYDLYFGIEKQKGKNES